ncbi:TetR/AcrR family transcriptional regulator [Desulfosporosinus sp. OT]|uniref:TetR/AcrR family transcriptional regulator n=1 Tax=Desulfosporosinus sp. OT TaxID=913865 RepID=UPI000223A2C6|nr:TetR/AcrR family transcriptional regulator [Desulfosporosinus sp. OT]EGW39238.1 bacterial regulatory s, tetR family protein [Desulfosporosinus sp. OT]
MIFIGAREAKQIDILQASIRVFSKHGFDGAKMEYIAKEAGIGKGTVYEYFESKEHLFEEILKFSVREFHLGLKACMDQGETIEERLLNYSRYNVEFLNNHMDIFQIAMQVNILSQEIRMQLIAEREVICEQIIDLVKAAKAKGECRADLDEELATFCIMGTLDEFSKKRVFCNRSPLEEIDHQAIVVMVLKGLRGLLS